MKSREEIKDNFLNILLIFVCVYVFLYFFLLGNIGLIDVDEPRYAEAGREMLESWNWIVPYFNYEVRYDKPVFFYWLEAISMAVFGVNEFSARLPSTITSLICIFFVFRFLKILFGLRCALIGSLVLMSSLEYAAVSRFSITDMTLSCFITCSIICFFLGYNQTINSHKIFKYQIQQFSNWYIAGFIFLALAFLTKGPVSIVLIGLIFLPFLWWIGRLEYFFKSKSFWIGFILFLIITFPWYLAVHIATSGDFTKTFFGLHNFQRFTKVVSGHKGNYFYFFPVVLIGFFPWIFFLPQAIFSLFKKGLRSLLNSTKDQAHWFCFWWFIIVFLFFSLSKTKLLTYILPLFPALSIIIAIWIENLIKRDMGSFGLSFGLGVLFIITIALVYVCMFKLNIILPREFKTLKLDFQILTIAFILLVGAGMSWASSIRNTSLTFTILLSTLAIVYSGTIFFILPKFDAHSSASLREFSRSIPKDAEIGTYEIIKPSITFYARRKVKKFNSLRKLQNKLNGKSKFAFATKKCLIEGITFENAYKYDSHERFVYYSNFPIKGLDQN